MKRLDVISERLARYTDISTNTDEKLENGAIMDWTQHSDDDALWLLVQVRQLLAAAATCERLLLEIGDPWRGDHWEAMQDVRAAIANAGDAID